MNPAGLILIVTGPLLFAVALIWKRFPPAGINYLYGYRTNSSMRNDATWKEANAYAPRLLLRVALALVVFGLASIPCHIPDTVGIVVATALLILGMAFLICRTERHLSRIFDKDGNLLHRESP